MKYCFTSITQVLQDFADFFINIIIFQHVPHFGIGRSQIEWNMKVKIEISICTGLMLNDHSNPYIESTTVLSDIRIHTYAYMYLYVYIIMHGAFGLRFVSRSMDEVKTITVTVCQAFIMNSDERGSQTSQKKRASGC